MYALSRPTRLSEVSEQYRAHDPQEFLSVSANKAGLLSFLCETPSKEAQLVPTMSLSCQYLGGDFKEESKSILATQGSVTDVSDFESTQLEADTRVILHNEDVE